MPTDDSGRASVVASVRAPRREVFGGGDSARTIAFTCDASGSMIPKFGLLRRELQKAIDGLRPIQQFSVTFYADKKAIAFENGNLVNATEENKRKAAKWLDEIYPSGQTDPLPSLDIAFKGKPNLLYMLTDGEFDNNAEVMKRVAALNKDRRTRVNTIAFIEKGADRSSDRFINFLTDLADQNGGTFKQVTTEELIPKDEQPQRRPTSPTPPRAVPPATTGTILGASKSDVDRLLQNWSVREDRLSTAVTRIFRYTDDVTLIVAFRDAKAIGVAAVDRPGAGVSGIPSSRYVELVRLIGRGPANTGDIKKDDVGIREFYVGDTSSW